MVNDLTEEALEAALQEAGECGFFLRPKTVRFVLRPEDVEWMSREPPIGSLKDYLKSKGL